MKLALIGLPQAGKTTLFNALTGSARPLAISAGRIEVHTEMVDVPEPRLPRLAELYGSQRIVYARIAFADVAGLGAVEGSQGLSSQLLNALAGMDGLLLVLRAFEDPAVAHPVGGLDMARDLGALQDELLLNDLLIVERRTAKLAEARQKGGGDLQELDKQLSLLDRLHAHLSDNRLLRTLDLNPTEQSYIAGYGLLTRKPLLVVINLGEGQPAPVLDAGHTPVLALQGKLEMELAQLPQDDAAEFLREYGLEESGAQRVIRAAYDLLDTQTFYTLADSEAHAWMLPRGASALDAASAVHSDIARGFIRAEIIHADELLSLGSLAAAREQGKLRLEGKDYAMQDGEVIQVRFNV